MYLQTKRRRGGLGQLPGIDIAEPLASWWAAPPAPYTPIWSEQGYVPGAVNADPSINDSSTCSTWDFFFNLSAWKACQAGLATQQIQTVPRNAAAAGYPPNVVAVAQAAADEQSGYVPSDVSNVAQFYGAGSLVTPGSIPTWLYVAGAIAGGLLIMAALK